jgi:hypothetical protein
MLAFDATPMFRALGWIAGGKPLQRSHTELSKDAGGAGPAIDYSFDINDVKACENRGYRVKTFE